ncbi:ribonuclease domain-containing protein [Rhodoferax sp.]|uniref:ribonuclease domain-containing protein n=1 Tax=Rhodoferax sp. TaxID=50421 RepID=UPI0039B8333E
MSRAQGFKLTGLKLVLTGFLIAVASALSLVQAKESGVPLVGASVALSELPAQGQQTYALIRQGGPFEFDKDGVVFGNRERLLPSQKRGFYREYTVKTPGSRSRGQRRIVCGGAPRTPDACYYTADHYASFRKILP